MNIHKTMVHARCPYQPVWDYYVAEFKSETFIQCEFIQEVCEEIRGKQMTQEQVFEHLRNNFPLSVKITLKGRHGQNGKLVIKS